MDDIETVIEGRMLVDGELGYAQVGISEDGRIVAVGRYVSGGERRVELGTSEMLLPGFIDLHVHLRDPGLSNKARGLLSTMLSLPDTWDYTTRGLAAICKDGVDAITAQLKELEERGYLVRRKLRDKNGRITDTEYTIYEKPPTPYTENPDMEEQNPEIPAQINKDSKNTYLSKTYSIPSVVTKRSGADETEAYREIVKENIGYDILVAEKPDARDRIDEILELIVETVSTSKNHVRVAGADLPAEVVRSRFMKLDADHIRFVLDCLSENTTKIRNIKQYLLTTLYNAPTTIGNYYSSLVRHDLYGKE